jgi:cysteinyl-tRNA synthetase
MALVAPDTRRSGSNKSAPDGTGANAGRLCRVNSAWLVGPPMPLTIGGSPLPMVGRVRMYVCGITPYGVTHLGHAATYIWADAVDRVLRWHGHTVELARNVTDVDEVLFAEARRRGEPVSMLATLERASFEGTMSTLRVRTPDHQPTAAQNIGHVIQLASALLERGAAYISGGSVYARTPHVATEVGLDDDTAIALATEYRDHPDDPAKEHPLDVVVWQETADEEASWPSPWGDGRPGWHAECAAMVLSLFGPSIDLHCGGADLAFPHHACEAALAQTATGVRPFSRAWMRAGTVRVGQEKMAKSTGNLVLANDLLRDHSPAAIRLMVLNRPWGDTWSYSADLLDSSGAIIEDLYAAAAKPGREAGVAAVPHALLDDMNVPRALAVALEDGGQAARTFIELLALS